MSQHEWVYTWIPSRLAYRFKTDPIVIFGVDLKHAAPQRDHFDNSLYVLSSHY